MTQSASHQVAEAAETAGGVPERTRSGPTYVPPTDIYETDAEIFVVADMPGVSADGVSVELEGSTLTIVGTPSSGTPAAHGPEAGEALRTEYRPGGYRRAFTVSDAIERGKIRASMRDGVLTLVLPKAAPAKTQRIQVQAG